jgi:hypothetical protein
MNKISFLVALKKIAESFGCPFSFAKGVFSFDLSARQAEVEAALSDDIYAINALAEISCEGKTVNVKIV